MVRKVVEIERKISNRKQRKLIVLGLEGKHNKTEMLYFQEIAKKVKNYAFAFARNKVDPIGIVNCTIDKSKNEELDLSSGDMAIAMFDVDNDSNKKKQIIDARKIADASKYKVKILTSNPCFEVWYLQHFGFSTKPFASSKQLKKEMRKHIPNYNENYCEFEVLYPRIKEAITNTQRLREHHKNNSKNTETDYWNPSTSVDELIEKIIDVE